MSVSQYLGVVPRSELKGDEGRAESTENYKTSKPGQIVLNRMSAASGALGLATEYGLVSPDYAVLQPSNFVEPKYLYYLMKSDWFTGQMVARLKGIGAGGESASVRTPRVNISDLGDIEVNLPLIEEQRRIADFLDSQSSRIDKILVTKAQQIDLLKQEVQTSSAGFFGHPIFSGSETKESRRLGPCLLVNEGGYWGDEQWCLQKFKH
jgi:type I restriction enzyme S subunit